ncbi:MAG: hypothetical protein COA46_01420 [Porticoccaceae bacterium]|nr:MAG: hypothetical protein COA46_01420 [Porticoccaceae bacterium]
MTKPIPALKRRTRINFQMSAPLYSTHLYTRIQEQQPRVGISACLIGENVRYDGANKHHALIQQEIAPWLHLESICPEVEAGLGIPRPPVQLIKKPEGICALGVEDKTLNVTKALTNASKRLASSRCNNFCAYIVKARSPSCGSGSTPIYDITGKQLVGDGLFVAALKKALPHLIIVEESHFSDIQACSNFVEKCYRLHKKIGEN